MVSPTPARPDPVVAAQDRRWRWGWIWGGGLALGLLAAGGWLPGAADGGAGPAAVRRPPPASAEAPVSAQPLAPPQTAPSVVPASAEPAPTKAAVRILALHQDRHGRWLARLQVGEGPPQLAQAGDVVARGLRVERIAADGLQLRRGLQLEPLAYAGPVEAGPAGPLQRQPPAPSVIVSPPGQEAPGSSSVERAILRASGQTSLGSGQ